MLLDHIEIVNEKRPAGKIFYTNSDLLHRLSRYDWLAVSATVLGVATGTLIVGVESSPDGDHWYVETVINQAITGSPLSVWGTTSASTKPRHQLTRIGVNLVGVSAQLIVHAALRDVVTGKRKKSS